MLRSRVTIKRLTKKQLSEYSLEDEVENLLSARSLNSSGEELPEEEWSSLLALDSEPNVKRIMYNKGLYDPGDPEICNRYIAISASSVVHHPYYKYPNVIDPRINEALFSEIADEPAYPEDGQDLYLALCKQHKLCPARMFHRGLLTSNINMSYYNVDSKNLFAMGNALKKNITVESFNLTDNFLNHDACYHLMDMLSENIKLTELNLSGCRIGPHGAKILCNGLVGNGTLRILNLERNELGDQGGKYLANAMQQGTPFEEIYLKRNNIGSPTATAFAAVFQFRNILRVLDLSWNSLFRPEGTILMITRLSENPFLEKFDLSWNGLFGIMFAQAINEILLAKCLSVLDLSNNKFTGEDIETMFADLEKCPCLHTLNLANNPLTNQNAFYLVTKLGHPQVKVKNLFMDNVIVTKAFVHRLARIKGMDNKKDVVVTYGEVCIKYYPIGVDPKVLLLNRVNYLVNRNKPMKNQVDLGLIFMQFGKKGTMTMGEFTAVIRKAGAVIDDDCLGALLQAFPGPVIDMAQHFDILTLVDYVRRKWPYKALPLTPDPEPIPPPEKKDKNKDKKNEKDEIKNMSPFRYLIY